MPGSIRGTRSGEAGKKGDGGGGLTRGFLPILGLTVEEATTCGAFRHQPQERHAKGKSCPSQRKKGGRAGSLTAFCVLDAVRAPIGEPGDGEMKILGNSQR